MNESRQSEPSLERTAYDGECFKKFCLFNEEKILKQGEIVRMTKLCDMFNKMLKEIDSSFVGVKTFNLKKKLRSKYPQLEFARPSLRNLSEIVYASHKTTSLLINGILKTQRRVI